MLGCTTQNKALQMKHPKKSEACICPRTLRELYCMKEQKNEPLKVDYLKE